MIVDSSALVAITMKEPGSDGLIHTLASASHTGIGTPTLVELGIVLTGRLRTDARPLVTRLIDEFEIAEVAFGGEHWREALNAFQRYGRGRHPAQLNFGDCQTYAVARLADEPLLFVGEDFAATDLEAA
ncbi:MAG: type II toxin-antitoxin system VapC family toxin [Nocardioidaceae bacterium]